MNIKKELKRYYTAELERFEMPGSPEEKTSTHYSVERKVSSAFVPSFWFCTAAVFTVLLMLTRLSFYGLDEQLNEISNEKKLYEHYTSGVRHIIDYMGQTKLLR